MMHRGLAPSLWLSFALAAFAGLALSLAGERRASAPSFSQDQFRGIFFASAEEAIRGPRPSLGAATAPARVAAAAAEPTADAAPAGKPSGFTRLISPTSLEDEIKRVRLRFDATITTPAAFKSGEFQQARLHLTTLAALFAVIVEHEGEVRWKRDAAAARDLFARSAANCKSGSSQVYNEAKLRKADLEDLVSGSGLASRQADQENDWLVIADRVPLMTYAEMLLEGPLKQGARNAQSVQSKGDQLRRAAELLAVLGEILQQEGMADADDEDYVALCRELTQASSAVSLALDQGDAAAVGRAVGAVSQSCSRCHEGYR